MEREELDRPMKLLLPKIHQNGTWNVSVQKVWLANGLIPRMIWCVFLRRTVQDLNEHEHVQGCTFAEEIAISFMHNSSSHVTNDVIGFSPRYEYAS
jgi:hypothetical protein